ncbi:MAG: response regulator, partial [Dehalococcoidia bacterium]|nr:response regulator [Dehalococcoidia bacterium]
GGSATFVVWDDWGGFYDHVIPPEMEGETLGFRLPALLVSPWAREGYISRAQHEHTSVLNFIAARFDLPPLSSRQAGAPPFTDAFDFSQVSRDPPAFSLTALPLAPVGSKGENKVVLISYAIALYLAATVALVVVVGRKLLRRRRRGAGYALTAAGESGLEAPEQAMAREPLARWDTELNLPAATAVEHSPPGNGRRPAVNPLVEPDQQAPVHEVIASLAHELKNTHSSILGFAQLLKEETVQDNVRTRLGTIEAETERAGRIVQDMLTFYQPHAGARTRVDINALVSRVLDLRSYQLAVEDVAVTLTPAQEEAAVMADPDLLQQVLINLISNSLHALTGVPRGERRLSIETSIEGPEVVIICADSGPGFDESAKSRAFEPFFTTRSANNGTGLGLAVSRRIVQDLGGQLSISDAENGGAVITVRLPVASPPDGENVPHSEQTRPVRILIVDDEPAIREMLQQMVMTDGYDAETAASGVEGLKLLEESHFDLVIADLKMPGLSGEEMFWGIVSARPALARRVIFITGDAGSEESSLFLRSVQNPTLEKPFQLQKLRDLIARVLASSPALGEQAGKARQARASRAVGEAVAKMKSLLKG